MGRSVGAQEPLQEDAQEDQTMLGRNALGDCAMVAALFGSDLRDPNLTSIPSAWLNFDDACSALREHGMSPGKIQVLEAYAGSANWASALSSCWSLSRPRN